MCIIQLNAIPTLWSIYRQAPWQKWHDQRREMAPWRNLPLWSSPMQSQSPMPYRSWMGSSCSTITCVWKGELDLSTILAVLIHQHHIPTILIAGVKTVLGVILIIIVLDPIKVRVPWWGLTNVAFCWAVVFSRSLWGTPYRQVSRYSHTGLRIFKQNLYFSICLMYLGESFTPYKHKKGIWKDRKAQTLKTLVGCLHRMWSLLSAVYASEDRHNYTVTFCVQSTKVILLLNGNQVTVLITSSAENDVEITKSTFDENRSPVLCFFSRF